MKKLLDSRDDLVTHSYQRLPDEPVSLETKTCGQDSHEARDGEQKHSSSENRRLSERIVPFPNLYANLTANSRLIAELVEQADPGLREALKATLETLSALFQHEEPGWDELKQKVEVSFVKATASTNTSVTSGIAAQLLQPDQSIGILNCGTGLVKFQFYHKDRCHLVRVLHDETPAQISLSALRVASCYEPDKPLSPNTISAALHVLLQPLQKKFNTRVVAVITGKLRLAWEQARGSDRAKFVEEARQVFEPLGVTPWDGTSYFVSQDREGALEAVAASNLLTDINPELRLMVSFGIGSGACQWATPYTTVKHLSGMEDPQTLLGAAGLKQTVLRTFITPQYMGELLRFARKFSRPVIALKSGCLIWLAKNPRLTGILTQNLSHRPRVYGLEFSEGQSLRVLMDSSVLTARVLGFEANRHILKVLGAGISTAAASSQPIRVDLRTSLFVAEPPNEMSWWIARCAPDTLEAASILSLRKQHGAKNMETGLYNMLDKPLKIGRATSTTGILLRKYHPTKALFGKKNQMPLRDMTGHKVGWASWEHDRRTVYFQDMNIHIDPKFKLTGLVPHTKFKFCSKPPVFVEFMPIPCFAIGTRLVVPKKGICTLTGIEEGEYYWEYDNQSDRKEQTIGWPTAPDENPRLATIFRYQPDVKLIVLVNGAWVPASVRQWLGGNRHELEVGGQARLLDLNEFNHTWREPLVDDSGGYEACMFAFRASMKEMFSLVEDAITGRKLNVADQLLTIHFRGSQAADYNDSDEEVEPEKKEGDWRQGLAKAMENFLEAAQEVVAQATSRIKKVTYEVPEMKDVTDLARVLLKSCQEQDRQAGCHRTPPFLIVAKPGSGKTWTMKQLVYLLSLAPPGQNDLSIAPFVIYTQVLASLIRRHDPLLHECDISFVEFYIRRTVDQPDRSQFLMQALRMRTLIVIVDGIDEAGDLREAVVRLLVSQLHDQGHSLVATSRPEGVEKARQKDDVPVTQFQLEIENQFVILDLKPLTNEQQERAIETQLNDNTFYQRLSHFSEVRKQQDDLYSSLEFDSRRWVEQLAAVDLFQCVQRAAEPELEVDSQKNSLEIKCDNKTIWDPTMRQRGLDGKLLRAQPTTPPRSSYFQSERSAATTALLDALAKKKNLASAELWHSVKADLDELYSIAEFLSPLIELGMGKICDDAKISRTCLDFAPVLKDPIRVYEKAEDDYATRFIDGVPSVACVTDIIRCRIFCVDFADVSTLMDIFLRKPPLWLQLIRAKNKFKDLDPAHFRNILLNLSVVSCAHCKALISQEQNVCKCGSPAIIHLFEVQIHLRSIFDLNESMHAHDDYDFLRAINTIKVGDQLDFVINKQMQLFAEIRSSPILLSLMIVVLDRDDHRLPETVYDLYQLAIDASMSNFIKSRPQLEAESLRTNTQRLLQKVALRNHLQRKRDFPALPTTDPDFRLWNEICAVGVKDDIVLSFIKVISQMELYQFAHLSFQELFFLEEAKRVVVEDRKSINFEFLLENAWFFNAIRLASTCPSVIEKLVDNVFELENRNLNKSQIEVTYLMLKNNTSLQTVELSGNKLKKLPQLSNTVTILRFSRNEVEFPSPLIPQLVNSSLYWLDLSNNNLNDIGVGNLMEALRGNKRLQILNLAENVIQNPSLLAPWIGSPDNSSVCTSFSCSVHALPHFSRALQSDAVVAVLVMAADLLASWPEDIMTCNISARSKLPADVYQKLDGLVDSQNDPQDLICVVPIASLEQPRGEKKILIISLATQGNAFVTCCLNYIEVDLRGIELESNVLSQVMLLSNKMTELSVRARDASALECLLSMFINANRPSRMALSVGYVGNGDGWGLPLCEIHLLLRAFQFWGAKVTAFPISKPRLINQLRFYCLPMVVEIYLLLLIPLWTDFIANSLFNMLELIGGNFSKLKPYPLNPWYLICSLIVLLPMVLDMGLSVRAQLALHTVYAYLLVVTLICTIPSNSYIPLDRRIRARTMGKNAVCINFISLCAHFVTFLQLVTLFPYPQQVDILPLLMLDLSAMNYSTLWLHCSLAALTIVVGSWFLFFGEGFRKIPFVPTMVYGFLEVPLLFNLLGNSFSAQRGFHAFTLFLLGLFLLTSGSVLLLFKKDYTGRLLLDFRREFAIWDIIFKFTLIFMYYALEKVPIAFFAVSLTLSFCDLVLTARLRPCTRPQGNVIRMGFSLWLALASSCSIFLAQHSDAESFHLSFISFGVGSFLILTGVVSLSCVRAKAIMPPKGHVVDLVQPPRSEESWGLWSKIVVFPNFLAIGVISVVQDLLLANQPCSELQQAWTARAMLLFFLVYIGVLLWLRNKIPYLAGIGLFVAEVYNFCSWYCGGMIVFFLVNVGLLFFLAIGFVIDERRNRDFT